MVRFSALLLLLAVTAPSHASELRRVEGSLHVSGVEYATFSGLVSAEGAFSTKASGDFEYDVQISIMPGVVTSECLGINVAIRFPAATGNSSQACHPLELGKVVQVLAADTAQLSFTVTSGSP